MQEVAFYDARVYDRQSFESIPAAKNYRWHFHEFRLSAETAATARGAFAVCVFVNDRLDEDCLQKLAESGVKIIALRCAGFNNLDLKAATRLGLKVVRVPAYSPHAVAEHAVGLLLCLNRKIHRAYNRVREHNFSLSGLVGFDLQGKTVGIIGTGRIGKAAAQIFEGFDTRVFCYDPFPDAAWAGTRRMIYTDLEKIITESDILSLHLPLLPETRYLLNEARFKQMKKGVFIINTSRGKLIQTSALIDFLSSGHIGGVALDVYEEEEGIFFEDHSDSVDLDETLSRLLTFPNVLVTAHQAFLTHEALGEIARMTVGNIVNFAEGKAFFEGSVLHSQ